jgi:secreted PhoX family phosphatase
VYVYTGTKQHVGNDVQRAGLDNGTLRGIRVNTANAQGGTSGNLEAGQINGAFSTVAVDTSVNGATQQVNSRASGITEFARPEDGHWADARTFYFVTTGATLPAGAGNANVSNSARLYKVTFAEASGVVDYDNGTVNMVLDAASLTGLDGATARSFDNITVAKNGEVLIQEDPGNTSYIAKTWVYNPATGTTTQIFESDRARFISGGAGFLTQDEESSGIIEITDTLGRNVGQRYFLGVMQAHYGIAGELVEGGQMYVLTQVPEPETYALMLGGLGMVGFLARRRRLQG